MFVCAKILCSMWSLFFFKFDFLFQSKIQMRKVNVWERFGLFFLTVEDKTGC